MKFPAQLIKGQQVLALEIDFAIRELGQLMKNLLFLFNIQINLNLVQQITIKQKDLVLVLQEMPILKFTWEIKQNFITIPAFQDQETTK